MINVNISNVLSFYFLLIYVDLSVDVYLKFVPTSFNIKQDFKLIVLGINK